MSLCMSFFISGGCDSFIIFYHFLYLGNISEPNQNFSIIFFLFFCPSPNIAWPLPLPCGPIVHCHIPCFHLMFFVTTFSINAEYINNIYVSQLRAGGPVIPGLLRPAGVEYGRSTRRVIKATRSTTVMNTISILWAGTHKPHRKVAGLVLSVLVITSS